MTGINREMLATSLRLSSRLQELGRRVGDAKEAVDVVQRIRNRPLAAVALALAAGAVMGMDRAQGGSVRAGVSSLVGALLLQGLKTAMATWVTKRVAN